MLNEAFNDNGTLRSTIWSDTIGPAYIPIVFAAAAAATPAKLYYNDYNVENPNNKTAAVQAMIKDLKARNIRIDGMGLQAHLIVGSAPSQAQQEANIANFAALGVEVAYTELDIRTNVPPSEAVQRQQKADYKATAAACKKNKACVGITLWDFLDDYSWIPGVFAGQGYGTPWLKDAAGKLVRKIAYDGIAEGLSE